MSSVIMIYLFSKTRYKFLSVHRQLDYTIKPLADCKVSTMSRAKGFKEEFWEEITQFTSDVV